MSVCAVPLPEKFCSSPAERIQKLLDETKNPQTRSRALEQLLEIYRSQIEQICRTTAWAKQWGFDDAWQEAVTHFFEKAIEAQDPSDLATYWDIRQAVKEGASQNIYPISVSPYIAQHRVQSFTFHELDQVVSKQDHFQQLDWHIFRDELLKLDLPKQKRQILEFVIDFVSQTWDLPTVSQLSDFLKISYESAQRAWNYFRSLLRQHQKLQDFYETWIGKPFKAKVRKSRLKDVPNESPSGKVQSANKLQQQVKITVPEILLFLCQSSELSFCFANPTIGQRLQSPIVDPWLSIRQFGIQLISLCTAVDSGEDVRSKEKRTSFSAFWVSARKFMQPSGLSKYWINPTSLVWNLHTHRGDDRRLQNKTTPRIQFSRGP
jgi:hypothetical protein